LNLGDDGKKAILQLFSVYGKSAQQEKNLFISRQC
jgi:hypothetical protein